MPCTEDHTRDTCGPISWHDTGNGCFIPLHAFEEEARRRLREVETLSRIRRLMWAEVQG